MDNLKELENINIENLTKIYDYCLSKGNVNGLFTLLKVINIIEQIQSEEKSQMRLDI